MLADFLLRARFPIFAAIVVVLGSLVAINRHVHYEQSLTSFFAEGDRDVVAYQKTSSIFGNDNIIFITYDDPYLLTPGGMDRLEQLVQALDPARLPAIEEVQSLDRMPLFWQLDDRLADLARMPALLRRTAVGFLTQNLATLSQPRSSFTVGGAIRAAQGQASGSLEREIVEHPLLRNTFIDPNGTTGSVVVRLVPMERQDPKATVREMRRVSDVWARDNGLARPALVGPPVLLADGFSAIDRDGGRLAVAGLALIGFVMLTVTRSVWWAVVPIVAAWTVWRVAETCLSLLGLKLSLSGGPLVAQIIVLTMPAASHLAIHFRDALRQGNDRWSAARETLHDVSRPIFWTATTGAIGYAALLSSNVVPVVQFGAVLAICTLVATLATLAISPIAMLPPFPLEIPVRPGSKALVSRPLNRLTRWAIDHPARVVLAVAVFVLPLSVGMLRLDYESNYINAFKPRTRVVEDYQWTEQKLGGIGMISLVLPMGPRLTLADLDAQRRLAAQIQEHAGPEGVVAEVVSLATVLDPQARLAALPGDQGQAALDTKLDLIAKAPQARLLGSFWVPQTEADPSSGHARMVIRIEEGTAVGQKTKTFEHALAFAQAMPEFQDPQRPPFVTGLSYLLSQTTRGVIESSWVTLLWSALGLIVMLTWAYRGWRLALLALLPAALAVVFVLGITGWTGVKLDLATALVASVALGLSVDDTFHCLLQYRRLRRSMPFRDSLLASYHVTGAGVLLSSLAVAIGFGVLRFGEFVPFSNFGTMVGIATLGSSIGNLVLLPACLALGERLAPTRTGSGAPRRGARSPSQTEVRATALDATPRGQSE